MYLKTYVSRTKQATTLIFYTVDHITLYDNLNLGAKTWWDCVGERIFPSFIWWHSVTPWALIYLHFEMDLLPTFCLLSGSLRPPTSSSSRRSSSTVRVTKRTATESPSPASWSVPCWRKPGLPIWWCWTLTPRRLRGSLTLSWTCWR